jgi:hypothetical protein
MIVQVKAPDAANRIGVVTDRSGELVLADPQWLDAVRYLHARKLPASVQYDPATRVVTSVSSAPADIVLALGPVEGQDRAVMVHLMKRPTLLHLDRAHPRFTELYSQIETAQRSKQVIALGVLPGDSNIEDVRAQDWKH